MSRQLTARDRAKAIKLHGQLINLAQSLHPLVDCADALLLETEDDPEGIMDQDFNNLMDARDALDKAIELLDHVGMGGVQ